MIDTFRYLSCLNSVTEQIFGKYNQKFASCLDYRQKKKHFSITYTKGTSQGHIYSNFGTTIVQTSPSNVRFEVFTAMTRRMPSSGMLRRVALVRTDVSEELSAFFIRGTRIGELGTTLAVTSNRNTVQRNISFETSVLTRTRRRNIPEYVIFQSQQILS
jgi:hypothetical protein